MNESVLNDALVAVDPGGDSAMANILASVCGYLTSLSDDERKTAVKPLYNHDESARQQLLYEAACWAYGEPAGDESEDEAPNSYVADYLEAAEAGEAADRWRAECGESSDDESWF